MRSGLEPQRRALYKAAVGRAPHHGATRRLLSRVGLPPGGSDLGQPVAACAAQMFLDTGDGIVFMVSSARGTRRAQAIP